MKRFIAILIALQIGLTPFCSVFAMGSLQQSIKNSDCEMADEGTYQHISHQSPQLICCVNKTTQEPSNQTQPFFDTTPPAIQAHSTFYSNQKNSLTTAFNYLNPKHPPDDFERSSRSKRE